MSKARRSSRSLSPGLIALGLSIVLLFAAGLWYSTSDRGTTNLTATFDTSVGVSPGTEIRVLGVKVGTVDEVTAQGDTVLVRFHVDEGIDIPAAAKAAQITPSVVSDRFIQLLPAYTSGPKMQSGASIPRERTATPVEVDRLYASVDKLAAALGPEGANADGALNRFVTATAETLDGNGVALGSSISELSAAATTLSDSRTDLSETVVNLQRFVTVLAENDSQVRQFNNQLATATSNIASQRENLQGALKELAIALADVARLVRDNQDIIASNAAQLKDFSVTARDKKKEIATILQQAPAALSNLVNSYDAESGTLHMRLVLPEMQDPASVLCKLMDTGRLQPGNPIFDELHREKSPEVQACLLGTDAENRRLKEQFNPLPLGILEGEMAQAQAVPGTIPGTPGFRSRTAAR